MYTKAFVYFCTVAYRPAALRSREEFTKRIFRYTFPVPPEARRICQSRRLEHLNTRTVFLQSSSIQAPPANKHPRYQSPTYPPLTHLPRRTHHLLAPFPSPSPTPYPSRPERTQTHKRRTPAASYHEPTPARPEQPRHQRFTIELSHSSQIQDPNPRSLSAYISIQLPACIDTRMHMPRSWNDKSRVQRSWVFSVDII